MHSLSELIFTGGAVTRSASGRDVMSVRSRKGKRKSGLIIYLLISII